MKLLILGKEGQVGRALRESLAPLGEVIALGRGDLELTDLVSVKILLSQIHPDIIVNAAAYTAVDKAESEPTLAQQINADVVEVIADWSKLHDALLVHYSTDYVFDGEQEHPYIETDRTNPQNVYGKTKRAGELAILNSGCRGFILRTSWVYSVFGHNFIKSILKLSKERHVLNVVSDQHGAPTSAPFIAETTACLIQSYQKHLIGAGLIHLTSSGVTSWYELACYVVDKARSFGMPLLLHSDGIKPISSQDYPTPAKRPKNSQLNIDYLTRSLDLPCLDWSVAVENTVRILSQREV